MEPIGGIASLVVVIVQLVACVGLIVVPIAGIALLVFFVARRKPKAAPEAEPRWETAVAAPPPAPPEPEPSAPVEAALRKCPSCAAENPPDNAFCEYCGEKLQ